MLEVLDIPARQTAYAGGALGIRGSIGPRWSTLIPVASLAGRPFGEGVGEGLWGRVEAEGLSLIVAMENSPSAKMLYFNTTSFEEFNSDLPVSASILSISGAAS